MSISRFNVNSFSCLSARLPRTALLLLVVLSATACANFVPASFEIVGQGATFSDRAYILSRNNRLSVYANDGFIQRGTEGLFANPAFLNGSWFLLVENVTDAADDGSTTNRLNNIIGLSIGADGERFTVEPSDYDYLKEGLLRSSASKAQKGRRSRGGEITRETATFQLTEDQFISVINADRLEVTVVGSGRREIFNQKNMAGNFQSNLFDFYHAAKVDEANRAGS